MQPLLLKLSRYIPNLVEDLVYATPRNFTGVAVYPPSAVAYLQPEAAHRLALAQKILERQHLSLKVLDAYRPQTIQKLFWQICPDPRYVADPAIGSKHSRAMAVDVTLLDSRGHELAMPTPFDEFSERASHTFQPPEPNHAENRAILREAMMMAGFIPYEGEWWHYDAPNWESHPLLDLSFEQLETL